MRGWQMSLEHVENSKKCKSLTILQFLQLKLLIIARMLINIAGI